MSSLLRLIEAGLLLYIVVLYAVYVALNVVSIGEIRRTMAARTDFAGPRRTTGLEPPISLIVPTFNEGASVVASVEALLHVNYPEFEVVVVNDGSTDDTFEQLRRHFDLVAFHRPNKAWLATAAMRGLYRSRRAAGLIVVDKVNGGKADALNAGLNVAQYPLYCAVDADSVLDRDSLLRIVQPFIDDDRTVAAGGTVRIVNGCQVRGGFFTKAGLPRNPLALMQVVEYLRAFLFGRLGWAPMNALMIISGAFGVFRRAAVLEVGGYRTTTLGEDMDLVMRLHRSSIASGRDDRVCFVPDPICWTEVPEDVRTLGRQRIRWQRGLLESLWHNRDLAGHGAVGRVAFPFFVVFEAFGPVVELAGYVVGAVAASLGLLSMSFFVGFLLIAYSLGVLLSALALLLEEISFRVYPGVSNLMVLMGVALVENLGYHQLTVFWRVVGMLRWAGRHERAWGQMARTTGWAEAPSVGPPYSKAPQQVSTMRRVTT